jgi:uncharacterized protein YcsI (UPF0317 family)
MKTPSRSKPTDPPAGAILLRGSLITLRRRCGKHSCRCARGQPHCSPALSVSTQGKTTILTLTPDLLREVRVALQRYRHQQHSLERQAEAGLRQLARRLQKARQTARR